MKKTYIFMLLVLLLNLPGAAFAAAWVRVGELDSYIDSKTVITHNDMLWFWVLSVDVGSHDKKLIQYAIRMDDPPRVSSYWGIHYNPGNIEEPILHTHSMPGQLEEGLKQEVDLAKKYAQEGVYSDEVPSICEFNKK